VTRYTVRGRADRRARWRLARLLGSLALLPLSVVLVTYVLGIGRDALLFRVVVGLAPAIFVAAVIAKGSMGARGTTLSVENLVGEEYDRIGPVALSVDGDRSLTWLRFIVNGASVLVVVLERVIEGRIERTLYDGYDDEAVVIALAPHGPIDGYRLAARPLPRARVGATVCRGTLAGKELSISVDGSGRVVEIHFGGSLAQSLLDRPVPSIKSITLTRQ